MTKSLGSKWPKKQKMKTTVIIQFRLEGIHNWPEAKEVFPDVAFLSDSHRHMFHFKMSKLVTHTDRDIEFIRWKRQVVHYLNKYRQPLRSINDDALYPLDFGRMSCEDIATELLKTFECEFVEVWEDGENGARVEK